ncbi:MAG: hypothetical protein B7Y43_03785 [Sphingomonas sp. 28-62-20]|nr:MAG: hypothetical protein B7Y43_03785 [Sphingomonas sp. 28-62-20]
MTIKYLAGFGLIAAMTTPAFAQQASQNTASSADDESIVVTGHRSISKSPSELKRDAPQIVDSLTQTQIETLPDRSLSDVVERIAGVNAVRGFGSSQGRTVTVRGFDARYNSMEVDGNLIWNSSRNNRGTQLDVFPSAVVSQIDVFKTVTPEIDPNSIGAHLSLRTLRAFDGGTQAFTKVTAAYGLWDQRDLPAGSRPTFRGDFVHKFTFGPEHQFGIVVGAEYQQLAWYDRDNENTAFSQINGVDVPNGNVFRGIFQQDQKRTALFAKVETRSPDKYYGFLSASYFNDSLFDTFNRGGPLLSATSVTGAGVGTGNFTRGTAETFFVEYRLRRQTLLIGSGLDFRVADNAALNFRAGYTRYSNDESLWTSARFRAANLSGSYNVNGPVSSVNYDGASAALVADPANWIYQTGTAAANQQIPHRDNVFNVNSDFNWNGQPGARGFGLIVGGSWRRLDRNFDQTIFNYTVPNGTVLRLSQYLDQSVGTQTVAGLGPVFINRPGLINYLVANATATTNLSPTVDYLLTEDAAAGHGSLLFRGKRFELRAGFRVEKTSFVDTTGNVISGVNLPDIRRFSYTNFLPNVQAAYEPVAGVKLRAAFTRTIARPDFADFANGLTTSVNTQGVRVESGANPFLLPRIADGYDLSAEYYFRGGYLSLGLFKKNLRNETFRQVTNFTDTAGNLTLIRTVVLNSSVSDLRGIEANVVIDRFEGLPGFLANFGVNANATVLDGRWNVVFTDGSRRTINGLRNQPKWLGNLIVTYNQGPFSANVAWRLQGRTFTGTFGATAAADIYTNDYNRLDAQIGYKITPNIKLFAEARNLTKTFFIEQIGINADSTNTAINSGATYWIGAQAKF